MEAITVYNRDTRLNKIPAFEKIDWVIALISKTFALAGQTSDAKNTNLLAKEILRDLETRYKLLAIEEVEEIFTNGVRGDYGEYFGINVSTISKWFRAYSDGGKHAEYLTKKIEQNTLMIPQTSSLTDGEIEEIMISGAIRCFNEYKANGSFLDIGNPIYKFLRKRGLLQLDEEMVTEHLDRARDEYKQGIEKKRMSINPHEFKDALRELKEFATMGNSDKRIQIIARRNAMSEYFESLIESGTTIEEQLNLKR